MRILYVATDQVVPGTLGGSVHVQAVAEGLAALGHDVHVATRRDAGRVDARVHWHALGAPANRPQLRLLRARAVRSLSRAAVASSTASMRRRNWPCSPVMRTAWRTSWNWLSTVWARERASACL